MKYIVDRRNHAHLFFPALLFMALVALPLHPCLASAAPEPADLAKADQLRSDLRQMIELARDRVFPALVNINVVTINYWGGKERKGRSTGSGTIISSDGYIVTNHHVTNDGFKFSCTLSDKSEISAKLIGEDPLTDLSVLKLDADELKEKGITLNIAQFGDSDELQTGDHVMAMGSPFALSRSVTLGIVSNTERVFASRGDDEEMELESGQRTGLFTRWIQHDAVINPGNSGGPLVNLKGEIIGVNELGGSAMGFAIPSNLARTVADALIAKGEVPRSWIGVSFKPIEKTGLKEGVLINSVVEGGPADKAGVRAGDVLLTINAEPITVRFPEEVPPLMKRLADYEIGSAFSLGYQRDDSRAEAKITTEKLQKDRGEEKAFRSWGLTGTEITDKIARDYRLGGVKGVLISGVKTGGPAQIAEPPLGFGDVVQALDGRPVVTLTEMVALYDTIMSSEPLPEYLLVSFERRGKSQVTLLKPKPDKEDDPPREVPKAWVGINTQPVLKPLAGKLGHAETLGHRVTRVYPGTVAAASDLKVGDVIFSVNGDSVAPRGMQDAGLLDRKVMKLEIGDPAKLGVLRGGEKLEIALDLERTRLTPQEARRDKNQDFEMTVREITFFDRDENRWDDKTQGVLVEQVESGGWAGLGGVQQDDLILRIENLDIKDLETYRGAMETIAKSQPERVVFVVQRGVETRFQYVEPDWKPIVVDDAKKDGQ